MGEERIIRCVMPRRYSMAMRAPLTERTRDGIARALLRLLAANTYEAITMGDVAKEADVAVRTVQRHFSSKNDILAAALRYPAEALAEELSNQLPAKSAKEDIRNLVAALFAVYSRHRAEMWAAYTRSGEVSQLLKASHLAAESWMSAVDGLIARRSHRFAIDAMLAKRVTIALTSYPAWRGFTAAGGFGSPEAEELVTKLLCEYMLEGEGAASEEPSE